MLKVPWILNIHLLKKLQSSITVICTSFISDCFQLKIKKKTKIQNSTPISIFDTNFKTSNMTWSPHQSYSFWLDWIENIEHNFIIYQILYIKWIKKSSCLIIMKSEGCSPQPEPTTNSEFYFTFLLAIKNQSCFCQNNWSEKCENS